MFECFIIQTFHSFHKSTCGSRKRCQNNGDLFIKFKVTNNIDVDFLFLEYFKKIVIKTFGTFSNNTCMVTTYVSASTWNPIGTLVMATNIREHTASKGNSATTLTKNGFQARFIMVFGKTMLRSYF